MTRRIGVCSWSLQPTSPDDLAAKVQAVGLTAVQLALDPLGDGAWDVARTQAALCEAGIAIASGMMRTQGEDYSTLESIRRTGGVRRDDTWPDNLANANRCARLARELGVRLVSFHAGFLPPDRDDPLRSTMVARLGAVIDAFTACGVQTAFETGQETADTLLDVLDQLGRPDAGVNFDPANMILYDHGDPIDALRRLAPHVRQIHVKDAVRTRTPGTWGTETAVGEGEVDWPGFFRIVRERRIDCDLMIEREAGGRRLEEIRQARGRVERELAVRLDGSS